MSESYLQRQKILQKLLNNGDDALHETKAENVEATNFYSFVSCGHPFSAHWPHEVIIEKHNP